MNHGSLDDPHGWYSLQIPDLLPNHSHHLSPLVSTARALGLDYTPFGRVDKGPRREMSSYFSVIRRFFQPEPEGSQVLLLDYNQVLQCTFSGMSTALHLKGVHANLD